MPDPIGMTAVQEPWRYGFGEEGDPIDSVVAIAFKSGDLDAVREMFRDLAIAIRLHIPEKGAPHYIVMATGGVAQAAEVPSNILSRLGGIIEVTTVLEAGVDRFQLPASLTTCALIANLIGIEPATSYAVPMAYAAAPLAPAEVVARDRPHQSTD